MITTTTTQSLSFGTDPVAGAVRSALQTAAFRPAGRTEAAPAAAGRPLEIERLYPGLSVKPQGDKNNPLVQAVRRAQALLSFRSRRIAT